jgi:hypothetical protein
MTVGLRPHPLYSSKWPARAYVLMHQGVAACGSCAGLEEGVAAPSPSLSAAFSQSV